MTTADTPFLVVIDASWVSVYDGPVADSSASMPSTMTVTAASGLSKTEPAYKPSQVNEVGGVTPNAAAATLGTAVIGRAPAAPSKLTPAASLGHTGRRGVAEGGGLIEKSVKNRGVVDDVGLMRWNASVGENII